MVGDFGDDGIGRTGRLERRSGILRDQPVDDAEELRRLNRLGQTSIHPGRFAARARFGRGVGGQRDNRHAISSKRRETVELGRLEAVQHRHVQVHEDDVEARRRAWRRRLPRRSSTVRGRCPPRSRILESTFRLVRLSSAIKTESERPFRLAASPTVSARARCPSAMFATAAISERSIGRESVER